MMANAKPANPFIPNSRLSAPPNSPHTMPRGNAKFIPTPETIEGTIESTKIPFMPILVSVCENSMDVFSFNIGNKAHKKRRKAVMIIRGSPK
jgi:hypothetical protein